MPTFSSQFIPPSPSLSLSDSTNNLGVEQANFTLHGTSSVNLSASWSAPDVKDVLFSQVLSNIASSWGSNFLARNFVEHVATRDQSLRGKQPTFNRPSPFKLAFQTLKAQLEEYHKTTAILTEENSRLKCDNNTLQKNLAAIQSRIQEVECSLATETTQQQNNDVISRMDKDMICRLTNHVVQLQRFTQSLVSLDFKQHPVIDHASTDVLNGLDADNALIDAILDAAAHEDSPWSRIYSAVLISHTPPPNRSKKHYSTSSSDGDTASTTSSRAYRHDAPPVLNNILAEFKAGLFLPMKRAHDSAALLQSDSPSGHAPTITSQQVPWANAPPQQIECGPSPTEDIVLDSNKTEQPLPKTEAMLMAHQELDPTYVLSTHFHKASINEVNQNLFALPSLSPEIDDNNVENVRHVSTHVHKENDINETSEHPTLDSLPSPALSSSSCLPLVNKINELSIWSFTNTPHPSPSLSSTTPSPSAPVSSNAQTVSYVRSLRTDPARSMIIAPSSSLSSITSYIEEIKPMLSPVKKRLHENRGSIGSPPRSSLPVPDARATKPPPSVKRSPTPSTSRLKSPSKAPVESRVKAPLRIHNQNLVADVFGIRNPPESALSASGTGKNRLTKAESLSTILRAQGTSPSSLKIKKPTTKPRLLSPLKINKEAKKIKPPPSPSLSSLAFESNTSDASPQTSPSLTAPSSPDIPRRIFGPRASKKYARAHPTAPPNPELIPPATSDTATPAPSCLIKKRFGSSGNIRAPHLKLQPSDKLSTPPVLPDFQRPSEEPSFEAKPKVNIDLAAPPSSATSTFGLRTRKISQMTANFMSSVESMINSSKSSSSTSTSSPVSPHLAPSKAMNSLPILSSPMSSTVSSPSPSPHIPSSSVLMTTPIYPALMDTVNPLASASPPSRPLPALPSAAAHVSNVSASSFPPPRLARVTHRPDIDVPEALNYMTFPIKWERYDPKPLENSASEVPMDPKPSSLSDSYGSMPRKNSRKPSSKPVESAPPLKLSCRTNETHPSRPPSTAFTTNRLTGNFTHSLSMAQNDHRPNFRSSYPPAISERIRQSHVFAEDRENERVDQPTHVDPDDCANKSDSSPPGKLNMTMPSARKLGKRRGIFLAENVSTLIGLPIVAESITCITDQIFVESSEGTPNSAEEPINYQNPTTLLTLDISPERINDTVERLVSSFSSSSLGSLNDTSESDRETLRERARAREHLENSPRDPCGLKHVRRATVEEELYKSGKGWDQVLGGLNGETEKDASGDFTFVCPPPLAIGLVNLPPPNSSDSSVKVVTWGGISVQNISSSETSSLASSSSLGSITSPTTDGAQKDLSTSNKQCASTDQQSPCNLGSNPPYIERITKPSSTSVVKSSIIPTSILKKSVLPTNFAPHAASAMKLKGMRAPVKKLVAATLPSSPSRPPSPSLTVNPVQSEVSAAVLSPSPPTLLPLMCEDHSPVPDFSSNSGINSPASVKSTDGSNPSSAMSGPTITPEVVSVTMPPVSVAGRFGALAYSGVISRSTVGPTAKRLSSGSLAPKRSFRPTISSPSTTSSSFQTKRTFAPGRQCPDTSRSFLAVPSRKPRSKTISSPLPPALCTPSPESLLAPSPSKSCSNNVPYSPATRSPLSQNVITARSAPPSSDKLRSTSRPYTGTALCSNLVKPSLDQPGPFPLRRQENAVNSLPCRPTGQPHTSPPMSRIGRRTSFTKGSRDNSTLPTSQQKRSGSQMPTSLIPTISDQTSLTSLQYRRLFRGTVNMVVR